MSLKDVTQYCNISGDYDFRLKSMKHSQGFKINNLGSLENRESSHSTFVMGTIKQAYSVSL